MKQRINQQPGKLLSSRRAKLTAALNASGEEPGAASDPPSKEIRDKVTELTGIEPADENADEWVDESEDEPVEMNSATAFLQHMREKPKAKKTNATQSASATGGKKRKAETTLEEDIAAYKQDLSHVELPRMQFDKNCNQVRKLINQVLDNKIMKKGEFCDAIGSGHHSLNAFLQKSGPHNGIQSEAYDNAFVWFKQRELAGLKMPDVKKRQKQAEAASGAASGPAAKKAKKSAAPEGVPDLSQIHLDGEEDDSVPVFDTADELRKKISAHLKTPGLTAAQFCRDLYAQLNAPTCKTISTTQLSSFRGKKGPRAGIKSCVFYAAYVYFEKLRLAKKKPKSAHRSKMEEIWPAEGIDQKDDGSHG